MSDNLGDRRTYLGASEVAAALGFGAYDTQRDVWEYKTGRRAAKAQTPQMRRGHDLEPVIAQLYTEKFGRPVTAMQQEFVDKDRPWLKYHADGLTVYGDMNGTDLAPATIGLVEFKAPGSHVVRGYVDGGLPLDYVFQVHTGMYLADKPWLGVAVYDFENHATLAFDVQRDNAFVEKILEGLDLFWECVTTDTPPPANVKHIDIPAVSGELVSLDGATYDELADMLVSAKASIKMAESDEDRIISVIQKIMSDKGLGLVQLGRNVRISWKPQAPTKRLQGEKLSLWVQELTDAINAGLLPVACKMAETFCLENFQTEVVTRPFRSTFYGEAKEEIANAGK